MEEYKIQVRSVEDVTHEFLKNAITNLNKYVYVCGPTPMMDDMEKLLLNLKVDKYFIIKEEF